MPKWLHVLSTVNPLSYEVHALRALLIGTPFSALDVVVLVVAAALGITTASTLLRAVQNVAPEDETPKQVFQRALALEAALAAARPITSEQRQWLGRYQTTPDYQSQRVMWDSFGDAYFG